jgi:hypothetical protein
MAELKSISYYAGEDLVYPKRPVKLPRPTADSTPDDYRNYATSLENYEAAHTQWREESSEYQDVKNGREQELLVDLGDVYGLTPAQVKVLYSQAYEEAHSSGLGDVIHKFEDLLDLVQAFNKAT